VPRPQLALLPPGQHHLRQEVGGGAIEASKIAGHSDLEMTSQYTFVALERQNELTKRIQTRLAKAAEASVSAPRPRVSERENKVVQGITQQPSTLRPVWQPHQLRQGRGVKPAPYFEMASARQHQREAALHPQEWRRQFHDAL